MNTYKTYRAANLESASHLDVLLATYDVLAEDLRLAGLAAESGNISERCRLCGHALVLIGHLESWTQLLQEPALESSLAQFYTFVRAEIMRHQTAHSAEPFHSLALMVCEIRASWQSKASQAKPAANDTVKTAPGDSFSDQPRVALSCSA